jgi:hypothetical protein
MDTQRIKPIPDEEWRTVLALLRARYLGDTDNQPSGSTPDPQPVTVRQRQQLAVVRTTARASA